MDADTAGILAAIGPRLRSLRTARGLTLAAVSAESGLSVSLLSRVETGARQPTLDVLIPLAKVYRVALGSLVEAPDVGDPRVHLQPYALAGGGVAVPLTRFPGRLHAFKHVLGPREPKLVSHAGHAWIYVLAGRLRLLLGEEEHRLGPGEVARFESTVPHWFGPPDGETVEILHLYGPRGDRPILRSEHAQGGGAPPASPAAAG
ncbi:helix-turn-helix domain-containing protein [Rothia sp. AR01]|uniref:Helix-turn-helix domain-containing protein n=1 Tax=Rothia santali TaxID=2949643 RepID=A0A9X2KKZ4_9MICC|nr:helix-turn-helix domain-containing protein [Rothia santali]MCP3425576.1 helix-turn-helix domain-containing protein [Rothia santali]